MRYDLFPSSYQRMYPFAKSFSQALANRYKQQLYFPTKALFFREYCALVVISKTAQDLTRILCTLDCRNKIHFSVTARIRCKNPFLVCLTSKSSQMVFRLLMSLNFWIFPKACSCSEIVTLATFNAVAKCFKFELRLLLLM